MKRHLITSALPYINGVKHLGNLIGSMLPADLYAKFLRQSGEEVLFICGTDEHGTPAEIAAQENHMPVEIYCHEMYQKQKDIYERFDIRFDYFGRSSAPSNHTLTQEIFLNLRKNGYSSEKEINQYYSTEDKRFLPDRYVEGTCPHCRYLKARGDQCDGCSVLLEPTELVNPFSSISGSKNIELRSTKHIFVDLDNLANKVDSWVQDQSQWPDIVKGIAKKWLNEGLKPRCITRDLKWGIEIPLPGFEGKVFYVWFDAPNAYISITQDWARSIGKPDAWEKWWTDSKDVRYTQFMAKDNIPFHAIFWPAILLAADMGVKKVDYIKGFHWLTYEKGKFSTSQKRGIFSDTALELFPADYWRYYLLSNCPETSDADFSFAHFAGIVNKDLADILGNFANRTLSLFSKYFDSHAPIVLDENTLDQALVSKASKITADLTDNLSKMKIRAASQALRLLWVLGNEYITEQQPWKIYKTNPDAATISLIHCVHLLRLFAIASYSFIPYSSQKILKLLNDPLANELSRTSFEKGLNFSYFQKNHLFSQPEKLFEKIDDIKLNELMVEFS